MKPSRVLRVYLSGSFILGLLFTLPVALLLHAKEIELNAALILPLCWNVLFMLILPLALDWSEKKYFKARFLHLEELAQNYPELKTCIEAHCKKLSVPNIRIAVLESSTVEPFSYGLGPYNPRLVVPSTIFLAEGSNKIMPSIEIELSRFARQELGTYFVIFTLLQIIIEQILVYFI